MASSIFRVSRTETEGQQSGPATLNKAQEPVKMRVYEDESDVDLSEIGDKEIFAVEEENDLANVYVTDLVQEGNMNPITSNAVARFTGANYSTDEVKTSNTWIDGKPIYRKVYQGVTNGASLGISNLNDIVSLRAISSPMLGANRWQAMPWAYNNNETAIAVSTSLTWSIIYRDGYIPSTTLYVILEYTKSTD